MQIKQFLPRGLFGRTFLIIVLPMVLLQIAVSTVFFDRHWSKMTKRLAESVASEIIYTIDQTDDLQDINDINEIHSILSQHLNIRIVYSNGAPSPIIKPSNQPKISSDLIERLKEKTDNPFSIHYEDSKKLVVVNIAQDNHFFTFYIPEGRLFSSSSYIFILWMVGLSIILFSIALIFMRNQIRPIYRLGLIAERLGRGIPIGNIKPTGATEIRRTTEAFVTMQNRINQFIEQRTTMLAGVSHDLRTPLTRMKLQLELMDDSDDKTAIRNDIKAMEQMIEGYLSFAKGDEGEEIDRINLYDVLSNIIDNAKRLSLNVIDQRKSENKNTIIWGKHSALTRAFDNIVSNAAQHASEIQIKLKIDDINNIGEITIIDNGNGIPENQMHEMMKPFTRGDQSRNQNSNNVGLGLAITNDIITSHGGKLSISNSPDTSGLCVTITLPL